jgi:hypothetical protein
MELFPAFHALKPEFISELRGILVHASYGECYFIESVVPRELGAHVREDALSSSTTTVPYTPQELLQQLQVVKNLEGIYRIRSCLYISNSLFILCSFLYTSRRWQNRRLCHLRYWLHDEHIW